MKYITIVISVLVLLLCSVAQATIPARYKNCAALNKVYPHGLGRTNAHDNAGKVFLFKHSTRLYNLAMSYNKRLDGDHDGIACEK